MPSVLVVDDSRRACSLVAHTLEDACCAVVSSARDGVEAIRFMERAPFDAVVIEAILPGLDAFGTIVEIRRRWPSCRVVAMSGGGRFVTADEALGVARVLGAHAQVRKPFTADELYAALGPAISTPIATVS